MTRTRATVLSLLVAPLVALAALVVGVGPASAHASLTGSDPADGATLAAAPGTVSFTFNEDIREPAFVVVTAGGQRVAEGEAQVDANVVTARVDDGAPAGRWTAAYRVVSVDGHAVTGQIAFEVEQPAPSATPSATVSTSASATPSPGTDASASPGASAETTQGAVTAGDDEGLWPPHTEHVVLAAVLLAAAAALVLWSRRRAR
ncbi:copper resistance CopC family protein [Nocardioides marmoraquaticus]